MEIIKSSGFPQMNRLKLVYRVDVHLEYHDFAEIVTQVECIYTPHNLAKIEFEFHSDNFHAIINHQKILNCAQSVIQNHKYESIKTCTLEYFDITH